MNNIGGIVRLEFCAVYDISEFKQSRRKVTIIPKKEKDNVWVDLPIQNKNTSCSATPEKSDSGIIYNHKCSTFLPTQHVSDELYHTLNAFVRLGCLVRYTNANSRCYVLGTRDFPLTGTIEEISGSKASDLAGYQLQLSSTSITPELEYIA